MVRSRNHLFIILLFVKFIYFAVDSFNQQRSRGFPHQLHNSFSFVKPSSWRTSSSSLYSYGDPDLSTESNLYRKLQEFLRSYDKVIYPEESDIPGVTFLSPVEWAPWMETIWFGNIYDYRSAFFQDVMYSNSKPFKEGALLYKDSYRSLMIALLYQRYKRFDTSSYSLINATFFNVFGVDSLRVGRYKVPLTNEVILCTTDPLTSTEMKRYLNTFNPIKLFASKYFQQKRKRQYVINITDTSSSSTSQLLSGVPTSGKPTKGSSNFLFDSVYLIEYGRLAMSNRVKDPSATIPISPLPIQSLLRSKIEVVNRGMRSERAVLAVPISEANSQYFLENLFQSIFTHLIRDCRMDPKSIRVLFGGDGRLLNDLATEIGVRVAVGNTLSRVLVATDNLLDSSTAAELCSKSSSLVTIGKAEEASSLPSVAIVLSTDKQGGIKGAFGVSVVFSSSSMKGDKNKDAIWFDVSHWLSVLTQMSARQCIEISPVRFLSPIDTTVRSKTGELTTVKGDFPVDDTLVKSLKGQFNFQSLKSFITKSGLIFTVDALGSRLISQTLQTVLKELGVDEEAALLNKPVENLQDFNGLVPDGIPSQNSDSATLFNLPDTYSVSLTDFQNAEAMMEDSEIADEIGMGRTTDDSSTDFSDCPDIGFVFNSDASQCSVLTPGAVLSPSESVNLLSQLSTPSVSTTSSSYAGLRFMLGWLTLLSTGSADSILNKQFSSAGRTLNVKVDVDISLETAAAVLSKFQQLQQSKNLISSILPDISVQNITTLLMPSYMNQEDDFKLLDDGIMNITVISEYLPSISALSISNASDTSTRNSTNNDSDSDSDIDDNSESVNVGVKDEVQILATQIDTVDDVIRNVSGSEIRIDFKDYPQMPVTLLLQPANAASQLVASSKEGKSDALITSLSDLFNQTSSSSSSSESSPRAFTLSLATSAYMEPSVFSNDKASVREQMSILAQDMLKALVKAMVASGSDELLPSNISSEHIRIRLLSE